MTGPWQLWSKQPPPRGVLCIFEDQRTGQHFICKPEDFHTRANTEWLMWKLSGLAREARRDGE